MIITMSFKNIFNINTLAYANLSATSRCTSLSCEHDCKSSLEGGVCTCPKGRKLSQDGRSCEGRTFIKFILLSQSVHTYLPRKGTKSLYGLSLQSKKICCYLYVGTVTTDCS